MKNTNLKPVLSVALALILCMVILVGCGSKLAANTDSEFPAVGVLMLKVNPEIAIAYDATGNVTKIKARNEDAKAIIEGYTDYEGKACKTVVSELVTRIGNAGYFAEEVEGEKRQINIEIETGSKLPSNTFLDDIANEVRGCVNSNKWVNPVVVKGESDSGISNDIDMTNSPNSDGVSNKSDTTGIPNKDAVSNKTDKANTQKNNGVTDYTDTDYGPNNDGVTDYNDTDYGPNNDGVTDYTDTDYGPNNDGATDYTETNYGSNNAGVTNYKDSSYGDSNYDDGGSGDDD